MMGDGRQREETKRETGNELAYNACPKVCSFPVSSLNSIRRRLFLTVKGSFNDLKDLFYGHPYMKLGIDVTARQLASVAFGSASRLHHVVVPA